MTRRLVGNDSQTFIISEWALTKLRQVFRDTWLFPRYITMVYMRTALDQAKDFAKGVMVDIGCGLRPYEPIFADRVNIYIGLDWPQYMQSALPDVLGNALHIPLASQSADTVLATELMEHLPSSDQFLEEIARVLRVDGVLILSVPFLEPLHEEPRDYFRYTPFSLRLLLKQHGFSIEHSWARGGWWSVTLGSFVNQGLYDWANPINSSGDRQHNFLRTLLVLPCCALAQWLGYTLDRLARQPSKYTLGYVVVAIRKYT